jgi:hypothetical protein
MFMRWICAAFVLFAMSACAQLAEIQNAASGAPAGLAPGELFYVDILYLAPLDHVSIQIQPSCGLLSRFRSCKPDKTKYSRVCRSQFR